ncbi:MAG: hypothetical protein Crog3KO_00940 [Crocinitomicaceae bacterium]
MYTTYLLKWSLCSSILLLIACSHSQTSSTLNDDEDAGQTILDSLGIDHEVAVNPEYRFQMVASSVKEGAVTKTISYGTDQYYYPASLVKIPAMLVLLEVLEEKSIPLDAVPLFDTINACGSTKFVTLSQKNRVSFRQMLTELIVASDNNFYNAIYHFVTPEELNNRLKELGFSGTHIYRAFTGCDVADHLNTYPYKVFGANGALLLESGGATLSKEVLSEAYDDSEERLLGSRHENEEGDIVDGPYDLNSHIEIPLNEMHQMMLRFLYPQEFEISQRWNISDSNQSFAINLMGLYPSEIKSVYRNLNHLTDDVYKYVKNSNTPNARTIGKLGLSYGFASESVYVPIDDKSEGILITYSVYVNENDVVNDGEYEYEDVARPFANELLEKLMKWHLNED